MEITGFVKIFKTVILGGVILSAPFFIFAYDDQTTHPALTQEIVKFFNASFADQKISDANVELIIQGSIDEDRDPRWLRHFYDPVHNRGLVLLENDLSKYPELAAIVGGTKQVYESSKEWSQDTARQAGLYGIAAGILTSYFGGENDFSWDRAIYEYAWGDKKQGLKTLGHILHLIEDASVPDHTRNDPHPPILSFGSPYEFWTKKFNRALISVDAKSGSPLILPTLDDYFDSLAKYSNGNFFSKDTIFSNKYSGPIKRFENIEITISGKNIIFLYANEGSKNYKLVSKFQTFDWQQDTNDDYFINDPDNKILSDYWSLLSRQAVLHGAGVVKLFFDEVEKEKQTKILYEKNQSWLGKGWNAVTTRFSTVFGSFWRENPKIETGLQLGSISQALKMPNPEQTTNPVIVSPPATAQTGAVAGVSAANFPAAKPPAIPTTTNQPKINPAPVNPPASNSQPQNTSANLPFAGVAGGSPSPATLSASLPPSTSGETQEDASSSAPVDLQAPDINFSVRECEQSLSRDSCLITPTTLHFSWSSSSTDISYFRLECAVNNLPCENFATGTTTATTTEYASEITNGTFIFSLTAFDASGNESKITKKVVFSQRPIVINEIAWGGTSASRQQDQWIELFNPTSEQVDLSGIHLKSLTGDTDISLQGNIPAHGYYIIENTAGVMSDIAADLTAPFGTTSAPYLWGNGETLALELNGKILDQTPDPSLCRGWCGGIGGPYYWSMERHDPLATGNDRENWRHWQNFWENGKNRDGLAINGTPKKRNTLNYYIESNGQLLMQDKTLTKSQSPYLVTTDFVIPAGKTLTIEPGAIIKLWGGWISVDGILRVQGTTDAPVVFTSVHDDDCGIGGCEDTDATTTAPHPGDWRTIAIRANGSEINHAIIRYGGLEDPRGEFWMNLKIKNADAVITNSIIEHSTTYGIFLEGSSALISSNIIRNNERNIPGQARGVGLFIHGGAPTIRENNFAQNAIGLEIVGESSPEISRNTFTKNIYEAIVSNSAYPRFSENRADGNGMNGILLAGGATKDYELTPDLPYVIPDIGYFTTSGTTFTIQPGTLIKAVGPLIFKGKLMAQGTLEKKIIVTSFHDDEYGGDTDSATTTPQPGDWRTLYLGPDASSSVLSQIIIRYGGTIFPFSALQGTLQLDNSSAEISNAVIEKNYRIGVHLKNSSTAVVSSATIQDTRKPSGPGDDRAWGMLAEESKAILRDTIFKNNKIGIQAYAPSVIVNNGGILFEENDTDTVPDGLFP